MVNKFFKADFRVFKCFSFFKKKTHVLNEIRVEIYKKKAE